MELEFNRKGSVLVITDYATPEELDIINALGKHNSFFISITENELLSSDSNSIILSNFNNELVVKNKDSIVLFLQSLFGFVFKLLM